ncbi:divalent-cation tolerance protein CutA-like isoform X4 [Cavia porcellus]|uniref:divalent-cation tolerance protein CutA-like isoform X4 n=1 Tax=Cavia porcellus TaxID=10141 RepID=UPI000661F2D8
MYPPSIRTVVHCLCLEPNYLQHYEHAGITVPSARPRSALCPYMPLVLEKKLAASVNILPKASSLYFWKGEIEEATEILLLIKTRTSKVPILSSYIRSVHPFEIPEVFSLAMDQGDVHYLKWLEDSMEVDRVG